MKIINLHNLNSNWVLPLIDISTLAREESNVVIGSQTIPTAYGVTVPEPKLNPFRFDSWQWPYLKLQNLNFKW